MSATNEPRTLISNTHHPRIFGIGKYESHMLFCGNIGHGRRQKTAEFTMETARGSAEKTLVGMMDTTIKLDNWDTFGLVVLASMSNLRHKSRV